MSNLQDRLNAVKANKKKLAEQLGDVNSASAELDEAKAAMDAANDRHAKAEAQHAQLSAAHQAAALAHNNEADALALELASDWKV